MFCYNCGIELLAEAQFCTACGIGQQHLMPPRHEASATTASNTPSQLNIPADPRKLDAISQWPHSQVVQWLQQHSITGLMSKAQMKTLTGKHLVMMYKLRKESPSRYYHMHIQHASGFELRLMDYYEFTYHLEKLMEEGM